MSSISLQSQLPPSASRHRPRPRRGGAWQGMPVRRTPPCRQLPSQTTRWSIVHRSRLLPAVEFLLRRGWLPVPQHATVGPFPRPEDLPRRHGGPHQRLAPGSERKGNGRPSKAFRCGSADDRPVAVVVEGHLPGLDLLESRSRAMRPPGEADRTAEDDRRGFPGGVHGTYGRPPAIPLPARRLSAV